MSLIINFLRDVFLQPVAVVLWAFWMVAVIIVAPIVMRIYGSGRRDRLIVSAVTVIVIILMPLWHAQIGYVRLIGLPHILVWTPLAVYLYSRRKHLASPWQVRWTIVVLMLTIVVSLGFDCVDTIRYILGERAPLT